MKSLFGSLTNRGTLIAAAAFLFSKFRPSWGVTEDQILGYVDGVLYAIGFATALYGRYGAGGIRGIFSVPKR